MSTPATRSPSPVSAAAAETEVVEIAGEKRQAPPEEGSHKRLRVDASSGTTGDGSTDLSSVGAAEVSTDMPSSTDVPSSVDLVSSVDRYGSMSSVSSDADSPTSDTPRMQKKSKTIDTILGKGLGLVASMREKDGAIMLEVVGGEEDLQDRKVACRSIYVNHVSDWMEPLKKGPTDASKIRNKDPVRLHGSAMTFQNEEIFEKWALEKYVVFKNVYRPKKKIVIVGSGEVGREVARELIQVNRGVHDIEIAFLSRSKERMDFLQRDGMPEVSYSVDHEVLKGADLVYMAAGVKANKVASTSRMGSLPFNIALIRNYGKSFGKYLAGTDAKVVVLTNPVEISSYLLWQESGMDPKNIIASGVELDGQRYAMYVSKLLRKKRVSVEVESAIVVGRHEDNGMVFLRNELQVNGKPITDLCSDEVKAISKDDLDSLLKDAEDITRKEGMELSRMGEGACCLPARAAVRVGQALLYATKDTPVKLSAAAYVPADGSILGIKDSCFLGLPLRVSRDGVELNEDLFLSEDVAEELRKSAKKLSEDSVKEEIDDTKYAHSLKINAILEKSMNRGPNELIRAISFLNAAENLENLLQYKPMIQNIFEFKLAMSDSQDSEKIFICVKKDFARKEFAFNNNSALVEGLQNALIRCQVIESDSEITEGQDGMFKKFTLEMPYKKYWEPLTKLFAPSPSTSVTSSSITRVSDRGRSQSPVDRK